MSVFSQGLEDELDISYAEITRLRAEVERLSKASAELLLSLERQEPSPFGLALDHEIAMRSRIDIAKTKLSAALAATGKKTP